MVSAAELHSPLFFFTIVVFPILVIRTFSVRYVERNYIFVASAAGLYSSPSSFTIVVFLILVSFPIVALIFVTHIIPYSYYSYS